MSIYRDRLSELYGHDVGSVVGCRLDRLGRDVSSAEIRKAVEHYNANREHFDVLPIGARRGLIAELFATS